MTQPEPPQPATGTTVLATTAAALALIALEARVQEEVEQAIDQAMNILAAYLLALLAVPGLGILTGTQLMSRPGVHETLTKAVDTARQNTTGILTNAYTAASYLAHRNAAADLATDHYIVPDDIPYLGDNLERLTRDIDDLFNYTQADLQASIADTYDDNTELTEAGRATVVKTEIRDVTLRTTNRAQAATSTAVHKGAADTQQAIYNDYQTETGTPGLMKRWVTTAIDPCGMCEALNGTMVGLSGEFDRTATTSDRIRPVWRNLQGPPRHPHCRCQIELVRT